MRLDRFVGSVFCAGLMVRGLFPVFWNIIHREPFDWGDFFFFMVGLVYGLYENELWNWIESIEKEIDEL